MEVSVTIILILNSHLLTNQNLFLSGHLKRNFMKVFKVSVENSLLVESSKVEFDKCCYKFVMIT